MVGFGGKPGAPRASVCFELLARRVLFALPVCLLLALGVRSTPAPGLREDEVDCEEALAHIRTCCGAAYTSNFSCVYHDNPGCDPPSYPDLDVDESTRVADESCPAVVSGGYCDRLVDHTIPDGDGDQDEF